MLIDKKRRITKSRKRSIDPRKLFRRQRLGSLESRDRDVASGRKNTVGDLLSVHFQAEKGNRQVIFQRNIHSDIDNECRLTHGRTGRDDRKRTGTESVRDIIELGKVAPHDLILRRIDNILDRLLQDLLE